MAKADEEAMRESSMVVSEVEEPTSPTLWKVSHFTPVEGAPVERRRSSLLRQWASTMTLMRRYKLGEILGTGADAKVVRAVRRKDGSMFAVKIMDVRKAQQEGVSFGGKTTVDAAARAERMRRELEIHSKLPTHAHVVPCFEAYAGSRKSYVVLGLCTGGTLLDALCGEQTTQQLSEKGSARIARQVLEAIRFLHLNGVVHRDIKLENLLLRDRFEGDLESVHVQLADFGSARYLRTRAFERSATAHVGTLAYMAPEQHTGGTVDAALDMWSFGIVLAALCTGRHPLRDVPRDQWHAEMQRDRLPDGAGEPAAAAWAALPSARDLARNVLRLQPSSRMTAGQALKHDWIVANAPAVEPEPQRRRRTVPQDARPRRRSWGMRPFARADPELTEPVPSDRRRRRSFLGALRGRRGSWLGGPPTRRRSMPPSSPPPPVTKKSIDEPPASKEPEQPRPSEEDLKLTRVLAGLRDLRRNKLQKVLLLVVAVRADSARTLPASALFESMAGDAALLTRSDVEDALLGQEGLSMRAADELLDTFDDLSVTGSEQVSAIEFVAGVLALSDDRIALLHPLLRDLDPDGQGTISKAALTGTLHKLRTTDASISHLLPPHDEIDDLLRTHLSDSPVTYDELAALCFDDATATVP